MWDDVVTKYIVPKIVPTNPNDKLTYELDKKARYALLWGLTKDVFAKVVYCQFSNDTWVKLETIYQGYEKVKQSDLLTLKTHFDNLRMSEDENMATYFLRVGEVVNVRR